MRFLSHVSVLAMGGLVKNVKEERFDADFLCERARCAHAHSRARQHDSPLTRTVACVLAAAHGAPIGNRKAKSAQAPADVEREIKLPEGTVLTGAGEAEVRRAPPRARAASGSVLLNLNAIGGWRRGRWRSMSSPPRRCICRTGSA